MARKLDGFKEKAVQQALVYPACCVRSNMRGARSRLLNRLLNETQKAQAEKRHWEREDGNMEGGCQKGTKKHKVPSVRRTVM